MKFRNKEDVFTGRRRKTIITSLTRQYGFRCWYCGKRFADNSEVCIDHIRSFSRGGTSDLENLALSCKFCNVHKFYHPVEEFLIYLAHIRTGQFECPILERFRTKLEPRVKDILSKSFF